MNPQEFDDLLLHTFEDQHLSRKEKDLIQELLQESNVDDQKLALYRSQAFAVARNALPGEEAGKVLGWLEEVVKVLVRSGGSSSRAPWPPAEAHFGPGDNCPRRIRQLLGAARHKVDICVFTITDNRISSAISDAHRRGVRVRIITDNDKVHDAGSDIQELASAGIPIKVDRTQYHMHHKFALFDGNRLLTGSYNWTRGAAEYNEENFVVTSNPDLVNPFNQVFEQLWQDLPDV
jgi:cardiolipin hydrolase